MRYTLEMLSGSQQQAIKFQVTNGGLGPRGLSAYEIALEQGFVGTEQEWFASLRGKKRIDFSYTTASPLLLKTLEPSELISKITIHVLGAFDGTGARLEVDLFVPSEDFSVPPSDGNGAQLAPLATVSSPDEAVAWEFNPNFRYAGAAALYLFIIPGLGATQGAGSVVIETI